MINLRHLTDTLYRVIPQNGDHIVTIDSVTSLYPMYMRNVIGCSRYWLRNVTGLLVWRSGSIIGCIYEVIVFG